jgi:hypothetical protein
VQPLVDLPQIGQQEPKVSQIKYSASKQSDFLLSKASNIAAFSNSLTGKFHLVVKQKSHKHVTGKENPGEREPPSAPENATTLTIHINTDSRRAPEPLDLHAQRSSR